MGNHKITYEMLHPSIVEDINKNTTGDLNGLETPVKDSIVGAINSLNAEYAQSKENREKLAEAIGEPLDKNDSIDEMVEKIDDMKEELKNNLIDKGVDVTEDKTLNELMGMVSDVNTLSYASEVFDTERNLVTGENEITYTLDFVPKFIFIDAYLKVSGTIEGGSTSHYSFNFTITNVYSSSSGSYIYYGTTYVASASSSFNVTLYDTKCIINANLSSNNGKQTILGKIRGWTAIG